MQRTSRACARRTNASSRRPVPPRTRVAQRSRDEAGLTLVEVIVAISLLGIFAIVFAPVLYTNLDISTRQTTIAYASQQAATYIDDARSVYGGGSCEALQEAAALETDADPQEVPLTAASVDGREVIVKISGKVTCPATAPGTARLSVTACPTTDVDDKTQCDTTGRKFAVVSTQILVSTL